MVIFKCSLHHSGHTLAYVVTKTVNRQERSGETFEGERDWNQMGRKGDRWRVREDSLRDTQEKDLIGFQWAWADADVLKG